ncbi:MAG TPA: SgcJ/EcaC family oxidoreductase [Candidatus Limnocylindrales bacterium]|nr:SgcJ/EcaC family oxidoreductase [Candidatus Limnocylindrales bacterium]
MSAKTPEECDSLFAEYVNEGDVDELVQLYEEDGVLVQQDGSCARGPEAIRHALEPMVSTRPRLRMNVVRTITAGDGLAILYNDWTMNGHGPDGSVLELHGKAVEVVRRQPDGSWLFVVDDPFARG